MDITKRITLVTVAIASVVVIVAGMLHSVDAMVAVAVGALIAMANFRLSSNNLKSILSPDSSPAARGVGIFSNLIRYTLLGSILYFAIKSGIPPAFFLIGLSVVTIAIFISYREFKKETA